MRFDNYMKQIWSIRVKSDHIIFLNCKKAIVKHLLHILFYKPSRNFNSTICVDE